MVCFIKKQYITAFKEREKIMKEEKAMFLKSLPCNPIPFANRIIELCQKKGTNAITKKECQACLYILLTQSYGQLFQIDSLNEYERLKKSFQIE